MDSPRPLKVMVADDSTTVRLLVRRILDKIDVQVVEAVDGLDAIAVAIREQPDVALVDVHMPGCDGLEVLRRLRSMPDTSHIETIILTAHSDISVIAEAFAAGASDFVSKPCRPAELAARVKRAGRSATERAALVAASLTDHLTGLPNRQGFDTALARVAATRSPHIGLALVDVDHFKGVNDTWGHHVGDLALAGVARRLEGACPLGQALRWGGEEFLVVFPAQDPDHAHATAERIRRSVDSEPFEIGTPQPLTITASVGYALARDSLDVVTVLPAADAALYRAKHEGRNRSMPAAIS